MTHRVTCIRASTPYFEDVPLDLPSPMTRTATLIVFLLTAAGLSAQSDFRLFHPGVQYLFDNPEYDAARRVTIATEFYGIRVATGTCDSLYTSLRQDTTGDRCVRRVPSPFGTLLCQRPDSTVAYFSAADSMVLYPDAEVGERWLSRDSAGMLVYAEVTALEDDVKTITFFSADGSPYPVPLRISRQTGVISGPRLYAVQRERTELTLAGRGGPAAEGRQLPPDEAYDSVAVGDIFHLQRVRATSDCPTCEGYYRFEQTAADFTAVDKRTTPATFTYRADVLTYRLRFSGGPATDSVLIRDTVFTATLDSLPEDLRGRQPGELIREEENGLETYRIVSGYLESCDLPTLRLSTPADFSGNGQCGLNLSEVDAGPGRAYTAYVPFRLDSIIGLGGPFVDRLVYRESAGETCGMPYDFSDIIIGTRDLDLSNDSRFQLFPNPAAKGTVRLLTPAVGAEYSLSLFTVTGEQVMHVAGIGESHDLDISALVAGTYVAVVRRGSTIVARRRLLIR